MPEQTDDFFFQAYDRDDIAYGLKPSAALAAFLEQVMCRSSEQPMGEAKAKAIDLGAGAGRDTLAIARAGIDVTSVDISRRGLQRIMERAQEMGVADRVKTEVEDVRKFQMDENAYDLVSGTTVLDHIPAKDAKPVFDQMAAALTDHGVLFVEVHTTEDPGCDCKPGSDSDLPVSETAGAVVNYFAPNQLASWAVQPDRKLRILHYEERVEWDYTHGPEHAHGKAILLAVRAGFHPLWFGQTKAFPRRDLGESS